MSRTESEDVVLIQRTIRLVIVCCLIGLGLSAAAAGETTHTEAELQPEGSGVSAMAIIVASPEATERRGALDFDSAEPGEEVGNQFEFLVSKPILGVLLDWYGRIESRGTASYFKAAKEGHTRRMDALLSHNPDLVYATDTLGRTGLHWAAIGGHLNEVRMILDLGGVPNIKDSAGKTALDLAIENRYEDVARLLLRSRISVRSRSKRESPASTVGIAATTADTVMPETDLAFRIAVIEGDVGKVKAILERDPALVNSHDAVVHWTPLHWAVECGRLVVAQVLLSKGADVNAKEIHGWTPLLLAKRRGDLALMDLLASHGAKE